MTRYVNHAGAILLIAAVVILATVSSALACACCSNTGSRYVEVEKLGERRMLDIGQMRFARTAKLITSDADIDIKGIKDAGTDYQLTMTRTKDHMVFALRDERGRTGKLVLAMPKTISIFEVDPRGPEKEGGQGPRLYKEWKLTANAAGDGLFRNVVGKGQKITLVLHGGGRGCTDYGHFFGWTLLVHGPADKFGLYGALQQ